MPKGRSAINDSFRSVLKPLLKESLCWRPIFTPLNTNPSLKKAGSPRTPKRGTIERCARTDTSRSECRDAWCHANNVAAASFCPMRPPWTETSRWRLTGGDVEMGSDVPFPDDEGPGIEHLRVHAVHHLANLRWVQILQEVVLHDGVFDQLLGPAINVTQSDVNFFARYALSNYYTLRNVQGILPRLNWYGRQNEFLSIVAALKFLKNIFFLLCN